MFGNPLPLSSPGIWSYLVAAYCANSVVIGSVPMSHAPVLPP